MESTRRRSPWTLHFKNIFAKQGIPKKGYPRFECHPHHIKKNIPPIRGLIFDTYDGILPSFSLLFFIFDVILAQSKRRGEEEKKGPEFRASLPLLLSPTKCYFHSPFLFSPRSKIVREKGWWENNLADPFFLYTHFFFPPLLKNQVFIFTFFCHFSFSCQGGPFFLVL
jgi:hypothetical protein